MKILGHRGCRSCGFFENSPSAFAEALSCCDGLETDASLTSDGRVFLVHDTARPLHGDVAYVLANHFDNDSRETIGERKLFEISSAEASSLVLKNREIFPSLQTLFSLSRSYPDTTLNIELKADHTALPVLAELDGAVSRGDVRRNQIILSSFNHPLLAQARAAAPDIRIGVLYALETQTRGSLYPWCDDEAKAYEPFAPDCLLDPLLEKIKPDFFNLEISSIRPDTVNAIRNSFDNVQIIGWTAGEKPPEENPAMIQKLRDPAIASMMYAMITDYPRAVKGLF
jgi:glycerophosphoryl diester phosphodiesterase